MDTNKERQVERLIHYTLRAGVSISATLLIAGLFIVMVRDTPRPKVAPPLSEILHLAFTANEVGWIYLGLLLLMATPVTLIMMLTYGYAKTGWGRFALIALLVLLLLATGLALGMKG